MKVANGRLRQAREAAGLTLAELAVRVRAAESTLSRIETGSSRPGRRLLAAIIRVLRINEEWLETGDGDMFVGGPEELPLLPEIVRLWSVRRVLLAGTANLGNAIVEAERALFESRSRELRGIKQCLLFEALSGTLDTMTLPSEADCLDLFRSKLKAATARPGAKAQLAREFKISPQAVSQWISGESAPEAGKLLRLIAWVRLAEGKNQSGIGDVDAPPMPETQPGNQNAEETRSDPQQE